MRERSTALPAEAPNAFPRASCVSRGESTRNPVPLSTGARREASRRIAKLMPAPDPSSARDTSETPNPATPVPPHGTWSGRFGEPLSEADFGQFVERVVDQRPAGNVDDAAVDQHLAMVEVDVRPAQAAQLAPARAEDDG